MRYTVIVQPPGEDNDHWLVTEGAANADRFAKWIHKTTGAPVAVFDQTNNRERLVLGKFDRGRT